MDEQETAGDRIAAKYAEALHVLRSRWHEPSRARCWNRSRERMKETECLPRDDHSYPLSKPIPGPDGEIHSLEIRDPDASILNGARASSPGRSRRGPLKDTIVMIARMANVPPSTVAKIKMRDLGEITEIINFFSGQWPTNWRDLEDRSWRGFSTFRQATLIGGLTIARELMFGGIKAALRIHNHLHSDGDG